MEPVNVVFFFPDEKLGGGPFWLMRLASHLSNDKNYKVYYIDYADGFSHKINEDKTRITFINFKDFSDKIYFNKPCILFAPIYYIHNLPKIHPKSKVLFFNWHNLCLPVLKGNMQFSEKRLNEFLKLIDKHNAEVFCDGAHYNAHNKIANIDFKPQFVPIIMPTKNVVNKSIISDNEINIAILGRLVIDKVQSINNLIYNAEHLQIDKIINIHIIGDGPDKKLIKAPHKNNIRLIYCGILLGHSLDEYLANEIDILFAMGTSVMEAAALGIPSVIVANEIKPYKTNEFVWFFDTKDYCLGWDITQIDACCRKKYKLGEIFNQIYEQGQKQYIGMKCHDFVVKYFSYDFSVRQLKKYLSKTTLLFCDVYNFYREQCDINMRKNRLYRHFWRVFGIIPFVEISHPKDNTWKFILLNFIPLIKIKSKQKFTDIFLFNIIPLIRIKKTH